MSFFNSNFFSCFVSSSTRVSDVSTQNASEKLKKKVKTPRPPIPMSLFPLNSQVSRL
ncbi:hypothetical protein ABFS82_14G188400 [Erythranthe guttata]